MEIQELRAFVAIAQYESFSKAADYLGYSQAAMTVRIKNLEKELNVRLFDRLGKKIRLTDPGRNFYNEAVNVLNALQGAVESVKLDEGVSGHLKIGSIDSVCSCLLPEIMKAFHAAYPQVKVTVITETPAILLDRLKNNELDLVYLLDEKIYLPWIEKALEEEEKVVFAVSDRHPISDGGHHDLSEIQRYPLVLTEEDASYRRLLDEHLIRKELLIDPVFQTNNTDLLLKMLEDDRCISYLPLFTLSGKEGGRKIIPVEVDDMDVHVYKQVIYHKDKWINRPMKKFFEFL